MLAHRNIRLLSWFNFFVNFEPHMPIAIVYFSQITGSFALGMTVFSVHMLSSSLFEVPTGILSDFLGRKYTMMFGGAAGTLSILCYALAGSFWMLALGSVFEGLMAALYSGNNDAFLHDTLKQEGKEDEYSHHLGRTSSLFQVGLGTSALLGSGIAYFYSLTAVFWIGVLPRFICIIISQFMTEPKVHDGTISTNIFSHIEEAFIHFKKNAKLRTLSVASILDFGFGKSSYAFFPVFFATLWPVWALGLARVISNAAAFVSFWFAGAVTNRFGALKSLIFGKGTSHIVAFITFGIPTMFSPAIISLMSIFFGVKTVAENTLLQREFTDAQRATMGSLNQFAGSILFAIVAFGMGLFADIVGVRSTLLVIECILFSVIFLYWKVFMHEKADAAR